MGSLFHEKLHSSQNSHEADEVSPLLLEPMHMKLQVSCTAKSHITGWIHVIVLKKISNQYAICRHYTSYCSMLTIDRFFHTDVWPFKTDCQLINIFKWIRLSSENHTFDRNAGSLNTIANYKAHYRILTFMSAFLKLCPVCIISNTTNLLEHSLTAVWLRFNFKDIFWRLPSED